MNKQNPTQEIRDEITLPSGGVTTAKSVEIAADPRREYVAATGQFWLTPFLRGLPHYIDDVTREFGDDLYERMLQDPQVASCINVLKASVIVGGISVEAATESDSSIMADDVAAFCRRAIAGLGRPLTDTLYEMLDGIAYGNKVAEVIYRYVDHGPDEGRLTLADLKVKPRRAVSFVVDAFNNVVGLLGLIPGQGYPILLEGFIGDPPSVPNLLPREKFAVLAHAPTDGDPRGVSLLRSAYNAWWMKQQIWSVYLKYLTQFAGPSLVGYTAPEAQAMPATDSFGNPILDTGGNPVIVSPEQTMLDALQAFASGTAAVFPSGAQVTPINMSGDGSAFLEAIDLFDRQIAKAILGQTLATEEGKHQARAASQTHQDVLDTITRNAQRSVENMILRDIVRPLIRYNWGDDALMYAPTVHVGASDPRDFAEDSQAISSLASAGYLTPAQYPAIDELLGLPARI